MKVKNIVAVLLVVIMVLSLCACGKIADKVAEKSVEKLVEKATGAEVDISDDGAEIKVDGASIQSGEDLKWPKDAMGELPEPKAKITFVMMDDATKGGTVALSAMEAADAKAYAEKLKEMGFKDGISIQDEDGVFFGGTRDKGDQVNFSYNIDAKECTIIYGSGK